MDAGFARVPKKDTPAAAPRTAAEPDATWPAATELTAQVDAPTAVRTLPAQGTQAAVELTKFEVAAQAVHTVAPAARLNVRAGQAKHCTVLVPVDCAYVPAGQRQTDVPLVCVGSVCPAGHGVQTMLLPEGVE
jgi:hypothetical protein